MRHRSKAIVALAVLLAGCSHAKQEEPAGETQPIAVEVATPKSGDIDDVLVATGETAALATVRLASPIAGRVTDLAVKPGDRITRGQVVAHVLSLENEAALAGFAMQRSSVAGRPASPSPIERDLATRAVPVPAPLSGLVIDRLRNAGEQVPQGEALVEVFDPAALVVIAQVPAEAASRIKNGLRAEIAGAGFHGEGKVDSLLPSLTAGALTVAVRITLADPKPTSLLHAAVECRITIAEHHGVPLIPTSALLGPPRGDQGEVFVVADGKAKRTQLTLGLRTPAEVEVAAGLTAADHVIVEGGYGLPDGAPVTAAKPKSGDAESKPADADS